MLCRNRPEVSERVAAALIHNYLKTFGNPRAVERFVFHAMQQLEISTVLNEPNNVEARIEQFEHHLGADMLAMYQDITLKGGQEAIDLLNLAAAFCMEMDYDQQIPEINRAPKDLVSSGYLSVWDRRPEVPANGLAKFAISRPFFSLEAACMQAEVQLLKGHIVDTNDWTPLPLSLSSLVLEKGCAEYLQTTTAKEKAFEIAVAASLYGRYVLVKDKQTGGKKAFHLRTHMLILLVVLLQDIFPAANLPDELKTATVSRCYYELLLLLNCLCG